jgi:hypothetical protein
VRRRPRLDLATEDLIKPHIQAIWLAKRGQDLSVGLGAELRGTDEVGGWNTPATVPPLPESGAVEFLTSKGTAE